MRRLELLKIMEVYIILMKFKLIKTVPFFDIATYQGIL